MHWSTRLRPRTLWALRSLACFPPYLRHRVAESLLRRPGQPGPAAEHVLQYLVSSTLAQRQEVQPRKDPRSAEIEGPKTAKSRKPVLVGQADFFYKGQYRQFVTPTMGAFAMTAPQVLCATSACPKGLLWARRRKTVAAVLGGHSDLGATPIVVLNREALALAAFLPSWDSPSALKEVRAWLSGAKPIPNHYLELMRGGRIDGEKGVRNTRVREGIGATIEMIDAALKTRHLALLALHPHDPDAMGLHLTMFSVDALDADQLEIQYSLEPEILAAYRLAATETEAFLFFLAGGTEEAFTQCSQNLFVKKALDPTPQQNVVTSSEDEPFCGHPLSDFFADQFEAIQITASADGVPGASPRNGQIGSVGVIRFRSGRAYLLIPYHPGNAIHGHAAKLWSNRFSTVMVSDDHTHLRRLSLSGRTRTEGHESVVHKFKDAAGLLENGDETGDGKSKKPVYWFVMRIDEVTWEREPVSANQLIAERAVCTINAGGEGQHTKKPKYFDTASASEYDVLLQHHREAEGRPTDETGNERENWLIAIEGPLVKRLEHLASI